MAVNKITLIESCYQPIVSLDKLIKSGYTPKGKDYNLEQKFEIALAMNKLTPFQREIAQMVYEGYTCREIAKELHTTRNQPRRVLNKLKCLMI